MKKMLLLLLSGCLVVQTPGPSPGPTCAASISHFYEWYCWFDGYSQEQFTRSCEAYRPLPSCVDADLAVRYCLASDAVEYDCGACDQELYDLSWCWR